VKNHPRWHNQVEKTIRRRLELRPIDEVEIIEKD